MPGIVIAFMFWFAEPLLMDSGVCHHGIKVSEPWYMARYEFFEAMATMDSLATLSVPVVVSMEVDSLWPR